MALSEFAGDLRNFYSKIFPAELFFEWLSYGDEECFSRREFSFTLQDDIYIRYLSMESDRDLREELRKKIPIKIDIGAVYNIKPMLQKKLAGAQMIPLWKELVFDIDMTDYDDIRQCCQKASICVKCWTLMKVAVKVIDRALRDDFGFDHTLWVYSGRRGVHCWVSDLDARTLQKDARDAIVGCLTLVKTGKVALKEDSQWLNKYHPSVNKSLKIVRSYFKKFAFKDQKFLETPQSVEKILSMLPPALNEMKDQLTAKWINESGEGKAQARWEQLVVHLENENKGKVVDEIMLACLYPRLDENVSIGINHLLKSPFCVHPGTGRICVPFNANEVDNFDPFSVPTVQEALNELAEEGDIMRTKVWEYLETFRNFVKDVKNA